MVILSPALFYGANMGFALNKSKQIFTFQIYVLNIISVETIIGKGQTIYSHTEVKMNNERKPLLTLLLAAIFLASCAGQPPAPPTPDVNAIMTQGVGTFVASVFGTQTAMVTPATPTPLNTPTFIPTSTAQALPSPFASPTYVYYATVVVASPTPTGIYYTATPNPSTLGSGCNNLGLINDLGNSIDTALPGQRFTHTWQVANIGTCDWLYNYLLVPVSGDKLAEESVKLNKKIEPNKWTQLTVSMNAPKANGTYTQNWRLSDGAGHMFGATLSVTIKVEGPTKTPKPTATSYP